MVRPSQVQESSVSPVPHCRVREMSTRKCAIPHAAQARGDSYTGMKLVATAMVRVEAGPKGSRASTQVCKE